MRRNYRNTLQFYSGQTPLLYDRNRIRGAASARGSAGRRLVMARLHNASRGHQGSGPRERRKEKSWTLSLLSVKSEDSAERQITNRKVDYRDPLDLQCKFITRPEVFNLHI